MRRPSIPNTFTPERKAIFLAVLEDTAGPRAAAAAAGIVRSTAFYHKANDLEFRTQWEAAVEVALDSLLEEAYRRAAVGVDEPAAQQVACRHVFVAGHRDQRQAQRPGHVRDEARLAAAGRALEQQRQLQGAHLAELRHLLAHRVVVGRLRDAPIGQRVGGHGAGSAHRGAFALRTAVQCPVGRQGEAQRCSGSWFGMPSIGHSGVPTVERVIASTFLRVPSGSLIHSP